VKFVGDKTYLKLLIFR